MKLETRGLRAAPGGREILHGIDLAAREGQFVGIIGPNGSGKSTLLKCIYRTLRPTGARSGWTAARWTGAPPASRPKSWRWWPSTTPMPLTLP